MLDLLTSSNTMLKVLSIPIEVITLPRCFQKIYIVTYSTARYIIQLPAIPAPWAFIYISLNSLSKFPSDIVLIV